MDTRIRLLSVAPYPEFQSLVTKVAKEFSGICLETFTGNLDYALEYMHSLPLCEYDAILSRGGTAQKLRASLHLEVFDVEVSVYDVLRTIKIARASKKKAAVVAYESITASAQTLCRILDFNDVPFYSVTQTTVRQTLSDLAQNGVQLIIGDVVSTELASKLGMQGILITSSAESIRRTIQSILAHIDTQHRQNDVMQLCRDICELYPDACFALDDQLHLVYANASAQKQDFSVLMDQLLRLIPTLQKERSSYRFIRKTPDKTYEILMRYVQFDDRTYCLFCIRETPGLDVERSSISYENSTDPLGHMHFLFSDGTYIRPTLQEIQHACGSMTPVLIWGEVGTEKSSVVRYIHRKGLLSSSPMVRFDCRSLTERQWTGYSENPNSILNSVGCTVFFDHIHMLSAPLQSRICTFIDNTQLQKRHHILATCIDNPNQLVLKDSMLDGLYRIFKHVIHMPSLNQRAEDLEALACLYFPELNEEYGQQVIGIEPEALVLLQAFHWPLNLETFQRALSQMVLRTEGYYISKETVRQVLDELSTPVATQSAAEIDVTGSLESIERRIILQVLREENMNQSNAARRLNISRSTLWRKIK